MTSPLIAYFNKRYTNPTHRLAVSVQLTEFFDCPELAPHYRTLLSELKTIRAGARQELKRLEQSHSS